VNDAAQPLHISHVRASVNTAPTGASILVDVKLNGTTSILTAPFAIAASTFTGVGVIDDIAWPDPNPATIALATWDPGDYLTVEVTQVGSTIAGSDLTVQVWAG
jgi:hypothetical protein